MKTINCTVGLAVTKIKSARRITLLIGIRQCFRGCIIRGYEGNSFQRRPAGKLFLFRDDTWICHNEDDECRSLSYPGL